MSTKSKSDKDINPSFNSHKTTGDSNKKVIGAYDAKTRLPEILRQVSQGQSFTVTNRGQAVAEITPTYAAESKQTQVAINNILNMDKPVVSDERLAQLRTEGRK